MPAGQTEQPEQDTHASNPPNMQHRLGPALGVGTDAADLPQQSRRPKLHAADLLRGDVFGLGAEPPGLVLDVHRNRLRRMVEHTHQVTVPTNPGGPP